MHWRSEQGEGSVRSARELAKFLGSLDPYHNPFGVLSRGGNRFIQTAAQGEGFLIEKHDGTGSIPVHARRSRARPAARPEKRSWLGKLLGGGSAATAQGDVFTLDEVTAVFMSYYEATPEPDFLRWEAGPV